MVFSGIVETKGNIKKVHSVADSLSHGMTLEIEPQLDTFMDSDIYSGCSIAVNGTCLTVTKFNEKSFMVDLAPETLNKTSFNAIGEGDEVNLERALKMNDRNSGHTVQGHVDGVGVIESLTPDGVSVRVRISTSSLGSSTEERKYMQSLVVPKGFIAVDGASLTVCEVNQSEQWFTLMLIPHTLEVLKPWKVGGRVNLELDCLAKYVSSTVSTMVAPMIEATKNRIRRLEILTIFACTASVASGMLLWRKSLLR